MLTKHQIREQLLVDRFQNFEQQIWIYELQKKKFTLISRHRKGALRVLTFAGQSAQPFDVHFIGIADEINAINIGRRLRHGNARRN